MSETPPGYRRAPGAVAQRVRFLAQHRSGLCYGPGGQIAPASPRLPFTIRMTPPATSPTMIRIR
jgi:hypothetical protein